MTYPTRRLKRFEVTNALYLGGANVALVEPPVRGKTGGVESVTKGADTESDVRAELRRQGYTVMQSHRSQTAADTIGLRQPGVTGPIARAVQAKRNNVFRAWDCNEAVKDFLGLLKRPPYLVDAGITREVWLKVDYLGWVARVVIDHLGAVSVTGTHAQEVERSITTMLAKASRPTPAKQSTLLERLNASCQ